MGNRDPYDFPWGPHIHLIYFIRYIWLVGYISNYAFDVKFDNFSRSTYQVTCI